MLNLYCGRDARNREAFLFDNIRTRLRDIRSKKSAASRVVLIVPAQYTLKAEEAAFAHLNEKGFFDLQILSGHRLMHRLFHETGQPERVAVNSLGRILLLRSVLRDAKSALSTFESVSDAPEFLNRASDLIASFKQNNLLPGDIDAIVQSLEPESILLGKLLDMRTIYGRYEDALLGKWIDTEDLLLEASKRVCKSAFIATSDIWYYDFYSFTQREILFLGELMNTAPSLSCVLAGTLAKGADAELFAPIRRTAESLQRIADERGVECSVNDIPDRYERASRPGALAHIEKQLYALPGAPFQDGIDNDALVLTQATDPYAECQTIASDIIKLCAQRSYKPEDIAVLTNDPIRQTILRRTFDEHGIPSFLDEKRTVLHHPLIKAIASLLNAAADNRPAGDILGFLKSGLIKLQYEQDTGTAPDIEDFENYVLQYHIRGDRFRKTFTYGVRMFGEDGLQKLEQTRTALDALLSPFESGMETASTVREKSTVLAQFLSGRLKIEAALDQQATRLNLIGMTEASQESRQMWNVFVGLLDQVVELIGEREVTTSEFRDILTDSFSDLKVGLLPQIRESILIGTVGRTRLSNIRVLFLAGVNDGILPAERAGEGILTDRELDVLAQLGFMPAKGADLARLEEQLLIYQAFSKPSDKLFVSYALADASGAQTRPSSLIVQLSELFPNLPLRPDLVQGNREADRFCAHIPGALYVTSALQRYVSGEDNDISIPVQQAYDFLLRHAPKTAQAVREGLYFSNSEAPLTPETVQALYPYDSMHGHFSFSPTRLETFAQCPFLHFVSYGLVPAKRQPFELGGREIGDVYHECLMHITQDLLSETKKMGLSVTHPHSPWMTITRQECDTRVQKTLDGLRPELFEGLLDAGKAQTYRADRLSSVAKAFVWHVIGHIRKGRIEEIMTEVGFGRGRALPPLVIPLGKDRVLIEGKIDRIDILQAQENSHQDEIHADTNTAHIKIIDYKSGRADFNKDLITRGLHLQLMVYLESGLQAAGSARPAGVFYCYIEDPRTHISPGQFADGTLTSDIVRALEERYRMEGLFIDDPNIVESIDGSLCDGDRSTVIPVRKKEQAYVSARAVSSEDFDLFRQQFKDTLSEICNRVASGDARVDPQKLGRDRTACTFCEYGSICLYDMTKG